MADRQNQLGAAQKVLGQILLALRQNDRPSFAALDPALPPRWRRMAQQALFTIERRRSRLDWCVRHFARRRVRAGLRHILWWGMAQILWGEGLPPPLAVDACVRMAGARFSRREANFVNAVLRSLLRALDDGGRSGLWHGAPPWVKLDLSEVLWRRWRRRFSAAELEKMAEVLRTPAPLVVRLRPGAPAASSDLEPLPPCDWMPEARLYRCRDPESFFQSGLWTAGHAYVQDPSTLLAPALLAACPGERVADLCAAPGGKTVLLAEALGRRGILVCMDRSRKRLGRVRENLAGAIAADALVVGDACRPPFGPATFDAVLLDVP